MTGRFACLTMLRNEPFFLRTWYSYYSKQIGAEHLYIIDHNSDWETPLPDELRKILSSVNVIRIPYSDAAGHINDQRFDSVRFILINNIIAGLRAYYDIVVHNDVDELFVPDPARWPNLRSYLNEIEQNSIISGTGIEVFHDPEHEADYDHSKNLFEQRKNFIYRLNFCKPHIVGANCKIWPHRCSHPFSVDPDIYLVHLKYLDITDAIERQKQVHENFKKGVGSRKSRWRLNSSGLAEDFRKLAALPGDYRQSFIHHEMLAINLKFKNGKFAVDKPCAGTSYQLVPAIDPEVFKQIQGSRRRLPDRFAKIET